VQSRTTRHPDGTVDIVQIGPAEAEHPADVLQAIYWRELSRSTLGLARFSGNAVRVLGVWPALLRFGPLADGARPIVGGIFAREPHGSIRWWTADGNAAVAVERFAPLLRGPLWRLESWFHDLVGRRYLAHAGSARS
jgi:hypothetical protein